MHSQSFIMNCAIDDEFVLPIYRIELKASYNIILPERDNIRKEAFLEWRLLFAASARVAQ